MYAGCSLKGFGFVPEVTACALTVGFRVGKVRVTFIDRLGFLPEGRGLEEGRSFP